MGFSLSTIGVSSVVCIASSIKAIDDDEGDDRFEDDEVPSIALLAGRFFEGTRSEVS
jgi:hypothetical protein